MKNLALSFGLRLEQEVSRLAKATWEKGEKMKRKVCIALLTVVMAAGFLTGCGKSAQEGAGEQNAPAAQDVSVEPQTAAQEVSGEDETEQEQASGGESETGRSDETIRLGGLKGPTTMGLVKLLDDAEGGGTAFHVDFTMAAAADELTPRLIQGDLDMAAVPCNLAAVLYNKTEGEIQVLCTNTLGVLSIVTTGDDIGGIEDLRGKTIYATGQGTTPEYSLKYLLARGGLDPQEDVSIEWKSEATEIVSIMAQSEDEVIAMLPQPFVTVAMTQVEGLKTAIDLNETWNALDAGSLVTGVMVARRQFVEENPELVESFLDTYRMSCQYANENVAETALLVEKFDIVKAPIAEKALPKCNITFMDGAQMQEAVNGYLQVLFDANPQSVGGAIPGDDFYFRGQRAK